MLGVKFKRSRRQSSYTRGVMMEDIRLCARSTHRCEKPNRAENGLVDYRSSNKGNGLGVIRAIEDKHILALERRRVNDRIRLCNRNGILVSRDSREWLTVAGVVVFCLRTRL